MNNLSRLAEFQSLLENYHIGEEAQKVLRDTNLVLLVGPTSSGRNTIIEELCQTGEYYHIVSDTTRAIRTKNGQPIEQNGREYWFRREDDVLEDLKNGAYMEAAIIHNQQVSGCNIRELAAANEAGKIAIKDIDPAGAATVHHLKPDAEIVFVVPPDFDTWMQRLHARGEIHADELRRRLESAAREFQAAEENEYYIPVLNDQLKHAATAIHAIATTGHGGPAHERAARAVMRDLYHRTCKMLDTKSE
jgi:guanylate kinase